MIQIYSPTNTNFSMNGDSVLFAESCEVHAKLNGEWYMDIQHPLDEEGRWKHIIEEAVISAPTFMGNNQLFRIDDAEKSDDGVKAKAYPIFFDSADELFIYSCKPTFVNGQIALNMLMSGSKYSGESNIVKTNSTEFTNRNLMDCINGDDPAFIRYWGGDVLYDNYKVIINSRAGSNHGFQIRYRRNMDGISRKVDMSNVVTRIVPVAYNGRMITGKYVDSPNIGKYAKVYTRLMEFPKVKLAEDAAEEEAEDITVCSTQAQLNTVLTNLCNEQFDTGIDLPNVTLNVDMVDLSGTEEYKEFANLETVSLGDTVGVYHRDLEISTEERVIEITWDCIRNKATKLTLGDYEYDYLINGNKKVVDDWRERYQKALEAWKEKYEQTAKQYEELKKSAEEADKEIVDLQTSVEEQKGSLTDAGKEYYTAAVSFTDDDCRQATYEKLFPVIKAKNIPYTIACPTDSIGDEGYMKYIDLKEMYDYGVKISGHTRKESNMADLTEEQLEEILSFCDSEYQDWGVNDVIAYAYCNGVYNLDYIDTIKRHFKCGLTVEKGINEVPLETYFLKRVEVFPQNQSYTMRDVEQYVDDVARDGGWLILMTHAWYPTFDDVELGNLIEYIKGKGIPIIGLQEGLKGFGNIVETGCFHKPLFETTRPFTVVDRDGNLYSNCIENYTQAENEENVKLTLLGGRIISSVTGKSVATSDPAYQVNENVDVSDCRYVIIGGWAYEGFNKYSFLKEDGSFLEGETATTPYADGGDYFERYKVTVPAGAKYLIVAGYLYNKSPVITKVYSDTDIPEIGEMSELETENKDTLVGSINEIVSYLRDLGAGKYVDITDTIAWGENCVVKESGNIVNYDDTTRIVSRPITVEEGEVYLLDCSANWSNALFCIYSTNVYASMNENTKVHVEIADGTEAGVVKKGYKITIPAGGVGMRVCCNTALADATMFKVVQFQSI